MEDNAPKEIKHEAEPGFVTIYYIAMGIASAYLAVVFIGSLW